MIHIFKEIVQIMHSDYSGWNDKLGWDNPEHFLTEIEELEKKGSLTSGEFVRIVKDYLLDFNDQHIFFSNEELNKMAPLDLGFRVRAYKNYLYITEVTSEKGLSPGIIIKRLDGKSIEDIRKIHSRYFKEAHRERENWMPVIAQYEFGNIEDHWGKESIFHFSSYTKIPYEPTFSVKKINKDMILITLTDFADPVAIMNLVEQNQDLLSSTENWVIDVRINYGGSDSSYFPLIPYLMPEEGVELRDSDEKMLFNCTLSNTERQIKILEEQLKNTEDEQEIHFLNYLKKQWDGNNGKGFVEFDFDDFIPNTFIKGTNNPKSVVILTDVHCGSSGESFVETCMKSRKVTVIGRPTMGLNDYSNLTSQKWEAGLELLYPTSRLSRIDKEMGMTGKGIAPHIYVPWTPEHLNRDIDLDVAISHLTMTPST